MYRRPFVGGKRPLVVGVNWCLAVRRFLGSRRAVINPLNETASLPTKTATCRALAIRLSVALAARYTSWLIVALITSEYKLILSERMCSFTIFI